MKWRTALKCAAFSASSGLDGLRQRVGTVGVEDLQEPAGEDPQVHAALGGELVQPFRSGCGMVQPVERAMFAPGAFVGDQRIDMGAHLDLLTATEAARVIGDGIDPSTMRTRSSEARISSGRPT